MCTMFLTSEGGTVIERTHVTEQWQCKWVQERVVLPHMKFKSRLSLGPDTSYLIVLLKIAS